MKVYLILGIRHRWDVVDFFSSLSQTKLDEFGWCWDSHYICQSQQHCIAGIPKMLFHLPENSGYVNQKHYVINMAL